jgi:predicted P-loop ATPase/GTPase
MGLSSFENPILHFENGLESHQLGLIVSENVLKLEKNETMEISEINLEFMLAFASRHS